MENTEIPQHLYKYRSLSVDSHKTPNNKEIARDLIVNQNLWFSAPDALNDPFEGKPYFSFPTDILVYRKNVERILRHKAPHLTQAARQREAELRVPDLQTAQNQHRLAYNDISSRLRIFSLSEEHLDLLMWPHYADDHRGICVRFDVAELYKLGSPPCPVIYQQARPILYAVDNFEEDDVKKLILTKDLPWQYEKERRLFSTEATQQPIRIDQPIISGIILGAKICQNDRTDVLGWIKECKRPMDVFQARFHDRDYALEMVKIEAK